jgi:hypothetical protein
MNGDEKKLMTLREADREIKRIAAEGFDAGYYGTGRCPFDSGTFECGIWYDNRSRGQYDRSVRDSLDRKTADLNAQYEADFERRRNKKWYQFWI